MPDDDPVYVEYGPDPGATRVYCSYPRRSPPRGTVHPDRHCPKLSAAWRLAVYPLYVAVNGDLGPPCDYCAPAPADLRAAVLLDEYERPATIQMGLEPAEHA